MKYEYITVIVITVRAAPIPSCYYRASWKNCISISIYIYTLLYIDIYYGILLPRSNRSEQSDTDII